MSDEDASVVSQPQFFEAAEKYEGYFALMHNSGKDHVVDTTTFESMPVLNGDPDGYYANVGRADALCGYEAGGRMCPLEKDRNQSVRGICGNCLRALKTREVDDV